MSKGLTDSLNMRSLEEILEETEETEEVVVVEEALPVIAPPEGALMSTDQMKGLEHSKKMDEIYVETLEVARKVVDMGMNIDPMKAPRMFEVANQLFKTAQDSAISKRDSELKLMKLIQDQKKIDIEHRRLSAELGDRDSISGDVIMVEDRNKLLAMLKQQKKTPPPADDSD